MIIIPWLEAKMHIKEADVLLFRASGFIGRAITAYTGGIHSHVGLVHVDYDLYCVEQREFKGGRSVLLRKQVDRHPKKIDVYRADACIHVPTVKWDGKVSIKWDEKEFTDKLAREVVDIALGMTGDDYGWRNIWEIAKYYLPGIRLLRRPKSDLNEAKAYVCSTLVTYSFRKIYEDPCPNLSDTRTTPADIAQSALFHYLFTIG